MHADHTKIRVASKDDAPALMTLCQTLHTEIGAGEFSPCKVEAVFNRAFAPRCNDPAIIAIAGEAKVEGSICMALSTPLLCEVPYLHVMWCFVLPEHRKSTHMRDLVAWAKRISMPPPIGTGLNVTFDLPVNKRTEAQARLLTRALGEPGGLAWTYNGGGLL